MKPSKFAIKVRQFPCFMRSISFRIFQFFLSAEVIGGLGGGSRNLLGSVWDLRGPWLNGDSMADDP